MAEGSGLRKHIKLVTQSLERRGVVLRYDLVMAYAVNVICM
jgi:hypothetical protein